MCTFWGFPSGSVGKESPAMQETWVRSLGQEDPLEKEIANHPRTLALPRESHGQRSWAGYSPWDRQESDRLCDFDFHFFYTFFISLLVAQAGTFNTMLNISGESGHPCFVSNFKGKAFYFSLLSIMLVVGLPYVAFVMLRNVPSTPTLLRVFIMKEC